MNARTQSFILLLFGVALLRLGTSDTLLRFVRPSARVWILLAAVALTGLAVWSLVASAREAAKPDAHGHSGASRAGWLALAPVVAVLVVGPPALGSFTAERAAPAVTAGSGSHRFAPLPPGDPVSLSMYGLAARAVLGGGRTLTGREVAVTGFVARSDDDGLVLARLIITCCAADAAPIFVRVIGNVSSAPTAPDRWVRVVGEYAGVEASNDSVPVLRARSAVEVPEPADPYD